jgi:hypothetical protein
MPLSSKQLVAELSKIVDPNFASAIVENYVEMEQRFFAGDWQPAELDGGRLCEAISRALYQLDCGYVMNTELPGTLCDWLEDFNNKHNKYTVAVGFKDYHRFINSFRVNNIYEQCSKNTDNIGLVNTFKDKHRLIIRFSVNTNNKDKYNNTNPYNFIFI